MSDTLQEAHKKRWHSAKECHFPVDLALLNSVHLKIAPAKGAPHYQNGIHERADYGDCGQPPCYMCGGVGGGGNDYNGSPGSGGPSGPTPPFGVGGSGGGGFGGTLCGESVGLPCGLQGGASGLGLPCDFGYCGPSIGSNFTNAANNDSPAWAFTKTLFSWQPQIDAWNKGYYKCLGQKTAGGAAAPVVTHAAGVAATNAVENGASTIAGAYYHFTDARFTAWGRYSEVLVPNLAPKIAAVAEALDIAGWGYFDYELGHAIYECSGVLQ